MAATLVLRITSDSTKATEDVAKFSRQVKQASKSTNEFASNATLATKAVQKVTVEVQDLVKTAAAGFGLAKITDTLFAANTASREFGKGIAEVGTLMRDTSGLQYYSDSVRQLAEDYGQAATVQTKALYSIVSAGQEGARAIDALDTANQLAIGGVTDVSTAANGLTSVLNAYAGKVKNAADVSDTLFVGVKNGKTTIGELSGSLGQVAGIASTVGVEFTELVSAISALTLGGVETSVATTQVRAALAGILKPTQEARDMAASLGIEFNVAALRSKGLAGFLEDVRTKTRGNEEALGRLFGSIEGVSAVMALTGVQAGNFSKILGEQATRAGATAVAYEQMAKTADQAFNRVTAAANDELIKLGTQMQTVLVPVALALADNMDLVAGALTVAVKVGGAYVALFVALPALITAVEAATWRLVAATTAQNVGFMASVKSVGALRVAGGALIAGFAGWEIGTQLRDQFLEVRLFGIAMVEGLLVAWERMKQYGSIAWEGLKASAIGAFNVIRERIAEMVENFALAAEVTDWTGLFSGGIQSAREFAAGMKPATSAAAQFGEAYNRINREAETGIAKVREITSGMVDYEIQAELTGNAAEGLAEAATDAGTGIDTAGAAAMATEQDIKDLQAAAKGLTSILNAQARALGDDVTKAALEYADSMVAIAEIEGELIRLGKLDAEAVAALTTARLQAREVYDNTLTTLESTLSVQDELLGNLDLEIEKLGMTAEQIEITEIMRRAENDAIREKKPLTDVEIANLEREVTARLRVINSLREQKQAQQEWSQMWDRNSRDASDAIGQFAVAALSDFDDVGQAFEDLGDDLLNMVKRTVAQMISEFARLRIVNPILNQIFGTALQTGGGAGTGILGNLFGGSGTGALSGIASALPGLLAIGGVIAGLKNPAASGIGTAGRAASYGVAGWAVGTVGYGAALGAAAGAGTAAGVAGGAASGAIGAAGAIPVVGWIVAAIAAIDMITGGKVFGTKYRPESATQTIRIGEEGSSASATRTDVRQRALFGGRQWRTVTEQASAEARQGAADLLAAVRNQILEDARRMESEAPEVLSAAIRTVTEYDKKGKVKSSQIFVDILGRSFKEATPEKAAMRIFAENTLNAVQAALNETVSLAKPVLIAEMGKILAVDDGDFGDVGGGRRGGGGSSPTTQAMGEVSRIAERWRKDAEQLYEGAQFLVEAVAAIKQGNNLLGEGGTLTEIADLVEEMQRGEETLTQTFQRLLANTDLLEAALNRIDVVLNVTGAEFVEFATEFVDAAGGMERAAALWDAYIGTFMTAEEAANELLSSAQDRASSALEDLGLDSDTSREEFRAAFEAALPSLTPAQIVQWLEASAALAAVDEALDGVAQVAMVAASFTQSLADAVFEQEASDFQQALLGIRNATAGYISDANEVARSLGLQGASQRDLALISRWATNEYKKALAALENAARGVIDRLGYGELNRIERLIAEMEGGAAGVYESQVDGLNSVAEAGRDLFSEWQSGIQSLQDYVDGLLVGELSPLSPEERFAEIQSQLNAALAGAQSGDINSLNALPQLADQYLRMLQEREASGADYSGPAQALIDQLRALGVNPFSPTGPGGGGQQGPVELVPSAELEELYRRRDELLAQQTAGERLLMAQELLAYLLELSTATTETIFAAAERLGVDFAEFIRDLGGDVTAETAEAVAALGDVANALNVELPDLADNLGLALGALNDTQSLLNDAFELRLSALPDEFRSQLEPLLRDVETASDATETNAALDALNAATNDLPEEFRAQLAPYLSQVDPITPDLASELDYLSDVNANTLAANVLLSAIRDQLIIANGGSVGSPDGPEGVVAGKGIIVSSLQPSLGDTAVVDELRMLRAEVADLKEKLAASNEANARRIEDASAANADMITGAVRDLRRASSASGSLYGGNY